VYKIHYIPKSKHVKCRDLEHQFGTSESVSIKNGNYRAERYFNSDILKTTIYDNSNKTYYIRSNNTLYWLKNQVSSVSAYKIVKLDSSATIENKDCEVYRYSKTALKVTFYIAKEKNTTNKFYTYPNIFPGTLVKLVAECQDYIFIQELQSKDTKTIDNTVFEAKNAMIVISPDDITNKVLATDKQKEILTCLKKSIGYPCFMKIFNTQGRANIELLIDSTGTVKSATLKAEYFKKQDESIRIYNYKRVTNMERKVQKKAIPLIQSCISETKFNVPQCNNKAVNTFLRFPINFSSYINDREEDGYEMDTDDDSSMYDNYDGYY